MPCPMHLSSASIEREDRNIQAIFGDYIDIYDLQQAVEDDATVRIYYESPGQNPSLGR